MHLFPYEETREEKAARRAAGWAAWAIAVILIVSVTGALAGCAGERYVSDEQDAALREACEPAGCRVMPLPVWKRIEDILRAITGMQGS